MSPLLRKEIRLILPFWAIALVLAVIPVSIVHVQGEYTFAFGLILLGLAPFGQEFALGTFSVLLAQPVERRTLWKTKLFLLILAGLTVLSLYALVTHLQMTSELRRAVQGMVDAHQLDATKAAQMHWQVEFAPVLLKGVALMLMGLAGGLWTTLLFRQTGAALWFTILIPGLVVLLVEWIFQSASGSTQEIAVDLVLFLYAGAGVVWARRMFGRAEDFQWLGETVGFFSFKSARAETDVTAPRLTGALGTLVFKELQSHQLSYLIAFGLLVLHLCTLIFRGVYVLPMHSEFRFAIEAVPMLWLLMPWLMGCVAIAEERKLGTMESQLCLPVNRWVQFFIKFIVVLVVGTFLGGLVPALVEGVGSHLGIYSEIVTSVSDPGGKTFFFTVFELLGAAMLIGLVSIFASSLTRNTLHALGAAVVFGMTWVLLYKVAGDVATSHLDYTLWRGPLILFIGVPVSILLTLALSFFNYRNLHAGSRVWLRNFAVLLVAIALICLGSAFLYQRPWELATATEPQHGKAQLTGAVQPKICTPEYKIIALLPDGRLWVATDYQPTQHFNESRWDFDVMLGIIHSDFPFSPVGGTFLEGSNWVQLAAGLSPLNGVLALRSDGSLWSIFPPPRPNGLHLERWLRLKPELHQIGDEHDWKSISIGQSGALAIKTNGTLWNSENRSAEMGSTVLRGLKQVDTNSDWLSFFAGHNSLLVKTNGDLWAWVFDKGQARLQPIRANASDWVSVSQGGNSLSDLVVHKDGTLWAKPSVWGAQHFFGLRVPRAQSEDAKPIRVGNDSDWAQLSGTYQNLFALKKDGRLVKSGAELFGGTLGRPSRYSDWLAVDGQWNRVLALAADGTLCMWAEERDWGESSILLAPSHRPVWSLNILTAPKE